MALPQLKICREINHLNIERTKDCHPKCFHIPDVALFVYVPELTGRVLVSPRKTRKHVKVKDGVIFLFKARTAS